MEQWDDLSYTSQPKIADPLSSGELKRFNSAKEQEQAAELSGKEAWQLLLKSSMLDDELFEVSELFPEEPILVDEDISVQSPSKDDTVKTILPKISVSMEMFNQFKVKYFKCLHLLYEDLKLNVMMKQLTEKLGFFLYCYARFLNTGYSVNYIEYYSRDLYKYPYDFSTFEPIKLIDKIVKRRARSYQASSFTSSYETEEKLFDLELLEEEPFDLGKCLSLIISGKGPKKYPILFQRSFFVMKVFLKYYGHKDGDFFFRVYKNTFSMSDSFSDSVMLSTPLNRVYFQINEKNVMDQKLSKLVARMGLLSNCNKQIDSVFLFMVEQCFKQTSLVSYSTSVRTVIENILREVRINLPSYIFDPSLPKGAFTLIGREDIYMNILMYPKVKPIRNNTSYMQHSYMDNRNNSALSDRTSNEGYYSNYSHLVTASAKEEMIGATSQNLMMQAVASNKKLASYVKKINSHLHNNDDLVFNEMQRILNISDMIRVKSKYIDNTQDESAEYGGEDQILLRKFVIRRLSVLVGRGCLSINSDNNLFTEVLHIPKINFSALIESSNRKITLDRKEESHNWPEFHSGVSVGLRIPREIIDQKNKDTLRTWIDYQKTNIESYDKPGLIYALGLQGLLYCFLPTDIYLYLKPFYEPRSIGIMLGLAASKIGSRDENIMKAVAVHLSCMLPENTDLQLAMTVECAALISVGLLYKGTCNKQFSQIMLREILARPNKEKNLERESYSLSAGFALGLINLGKGRHLNFKLDSSLDSELLRLVEGGKSSQSEQINKRCSNIKEGDFINTQLVSPSALMALAFIYMKSENQQIANKITVPSFFYEIENCNPNHMVYKILAKNMIMWSKIVATQQFISDQIPPLIKMIVESRIEDIYDKCYSTFNIDEIDFSGITLIYYNIIGGCVMAIAMKYAGSGDPRAKTLIIEEIEKLRKIKPLKSDFCSDKSTKNRLELYNLFNLFSIHCLALGIVMAGTMDAECLKIMRVIRKKLQFQYHSHYGFNMAIHMAIGFLGLGSGGYTFGKGELDIACLLISVFPHFPLEMNDNQYHLQALRHFYVLAVKPNLFHSIDVDTGESVRVKFKIDIQSENELAGSSQKQSFTPILLQGSNHWKSIVLSDPDYHDTKFSFDRFTDGFIPRLLFVRKKYSTEVNKKQLERAIAKRKTITDQDFNGAELQKLFGNHLFKFIYKCLRKYARKRELNYENRRYLGLSDTENSGDASLPEFDFSELFEVLYAVLDSSRPFYIYEYLNFLSAGSTCTQSPFSSFRDMFCGDRQTIEDIRMLQKYYTSGIKEKEVKMPVAKTFEANLYKLKNDLKDKLKFTEEEITVLRRSTDELASTHKMPNIISMFSKPSDYRKFVVKLRLNEVVLPTVLQKITSNCRAVRNQLVTEGRSLNLDSEKVLSIISEAPLVKENGLGGIIRSLIE